LPKVVRAFSLDESVSDDLNLHTQVAGKSKPMNKSKYVNEALKFYMGKNIKEMIEQNRTLKENLTAGLRAKDASIGGLEASIASAKLTMERLERELIEARASQDCRCLWCRLMRRLQKSQAEQ
tara:strand:- start:1093 stop:1461 length:369 start_codon:yes stop_codon:yes gene_type:complete